jgi:hypothetical protein
MGPNICWLLYGAPRVSGTGNRVPYPSPPDPMGMIFLPFNSPWGANCNHPRPLMNEFPAGNRGTGPRCHLYTGRSNHPAGIPSHRSIKRTEPPYRRPSRAGFRHCWVLTRCGGERKPRVSTQIGVAAVLSASLQPGGVPQGCEGVVCARRCVPSKWLMPGGEKKR